MYKLAAFRHKLSQKAIDDAEECIQSDCFHCYLSPWTGKIKRRFVVANYPYLKKSVRILREAGYNTIDINSITRIIHGER